ncbi:MAG: M15 family metallopeptidase [Dysosmobacter sp.]|jgi:D-alanyl-D-alanine carboxypeptidase|uniref:M15 family metallopeptidase n=1 Tax=Dysosmobacter sp. TaxID=2591382 RepID=UPI003D8E357F
MKRKHLWAVLLAAAVLSGLLLGSGVLAVEESSPAELEAAQEVPVQTDETAVQQPAPAEEPSLEKDVVTLEETADLDAMPLLVNLWNPLPEQYTVKLEKLDNGLQIAAEARPALEKMLSDCEAAGMDVTVCSAYRTESTQNRLYQNKIARLRAAGYSREEALAEAGRWVAPPGTSEHQTGLAVDIMATDYPVLDQKQAQTEEQQWLMEHCWEYGFILRYPTDKSSVTGIGYEPWHYRYVGQETAASIYERGLCLEEYIAVPEVEGASEKLQAAVDAALAPGGGWQLPVANSNTDSKAE